ncbi:hypothetical protein ACP4OV_030662 [Aristida adscensionis]
MTDERAVPVQSNGGGRSPASLEMEKKTGATPPPATGKELAQDRPT